MIKVKNIGSSVVYLIAPDYKFHRKLQPKRELPIPEEVYNELTFEPGFQTLIKIGMIKVTGASEGNNEIIETENNIVSREELEKIFDANDVTKFAQIIPNMSFAGKESAVSIALEKHITTPGFASLIKKYCGVDIIQALAMQEA